MIQEIYQNRFREFKTLNKTEHALMVDAFLIWHRKGELNLSPSYQREYVWGQKEQQEFLTTLITGFPIGVIAIADDRDYVEKNWIEVVDGKQRLTTIIKFCNNEIPLTLPDGTALFWGDLNAAEKRKFRGIGIPAIGLRECTQKDRIAFFLRTNFAGVPQSEEHMNRVMELYKNV